MSENLSSDPTNEKFYWDAEYSLRMKIVDKDKEIANLIYLIEKHVAEIERLEWLLEKKDAKPL